MSKSYILILKIVQERFTALANILSNGSYDVVVLQEVWFKEQYDIIKDTMSPFRGVTWMLKRTLYSI